MARKPKRDKKTGQFVSNENTPFAQGGNGVPDGWTVTPDKPSKSKKQKLPKVIRHSDPVNTNYHHDLIKARLKLHKEIAKVGGSSEMTSKMSAFASEFEKQEKRDSAAKARASKAKQQKKEKKESKSEAQE